MPFKFFYTLQSSDISEYKHLLDLQVIKDSFQIQLKSIIMLNKEEIDKKNAEYALSEQDCVNYENNVFSFPICWFRAFIHSLNLPNKILIEDLNTSLPIFREDTINVDDLVKNVLTKIYDYNDSKNHDPDLKSIIEKCFVYMIIYKYEQPQVSKYRFKDDILMLLLRLLHKYKPSTYTNPGFYGDFVYYYPKNIFSEFEIFKDHFQVIDLRKKSNNSILPANEPIKKHLLVMYKYNQRKIVEMPGYYLSSIFMLNYNMFKLRNTFSNHAICIYKCKNKWFSNEFQNNVIEGSQTGEIELEKIENDIPQSCFHKKYNFKFNITRGCRIFHYVKQPSIISATTNESFREQSILNIEKDITCYSISYVLSSLMKITKKFNITFTLSNDNTYTFDYYLELNPQGYIHYINNEGPNREYKYIKVERGVDGYSFDFTEFITNEPTTINTTCINRLLHKEAIAMAVISNKVTENINNTIKNVKLNEVNSIYNINFLPFPNKTFIGGKYKKQIIYNDNIYKIRKDSLRKKYIISGKKRIYLSSIKGNYIYM